MACAKAPTNDTQNTSEPPAINSVDVVKANAQELTVAAGESGEALVRLQITDGYHVNANPASFDYLIPTTLRLPGLPGARMQYPSGALLKAKFAPEGIRVYSDTVELVAQLAKGSLAHAAALRATVDAQACTDSVCLPPSQIPLTVRMKR